MKPQVLEQAQSTVEAFLREQRMKAALELRSVEPQVDGDGDEFLWIYLTYDDGSEGKGLPGALERIRLKISLRAALEDADVEAFPVISFVAQSEANEDVE